MNGKPLESDWKIYRKRVNEWRERYLARKNQDIIRVLTKENLTPTERFWNAKEKMEKEAQILEDCLGYFSRSKMMWSLFLMHRHGLIQDADLEEFSEDLKNRVLAASSV